MVDELRGYSEADDVDSYADALELFGFDEEPTDDEIDDKFRDLTAEYHPDTGGSTGLFQAINRAREILEGKIQATGQPEDVAEEEDDTGPTAETDGEDFETGGVQFGTIGQKIPDSEIDPQRRRVRNAVKSLLRTNTSEEVLKDRYGPNADVETLSRVLGDIILMGWIDMADVENLGSGKDERFGSRGSGFDDRFGRGRSGGFDDRFGR